jgi:hypothetical protein
METDTLAKIAVLVAVALVWLGLNLKAGTTWLKFVSLWAMMGFLVSASFVAIDAVFGFGIL